MKLRQVNINLTRIVQLCINGMFVGNDLETHIAFQVHKRIKHARELGWSTPRIKAAAKHWIMKECEAAGRRIPRELRQLRL